MNVFELFATLSLDTSGYDEALDASETKGSNFASKLGGGLKTAGKIGAAGIALAGAATVAASKTFVNSASDVATYGDMIDKTSQKLGLSTEAYQEWDYVLKLSGTEMSSMTVGLKTLTNKLDEAKNGSEDAQAMFATLGISMDDINSMSREDLFEQTIYGFQAMEDSTERAALANDLFGKSGQNLTPLFNQTAEATREQIETAHEYGMVMSQEAVDASADFIDAQTKMQGTMAGLKNNMMADFLPSMTTVMDGLSAVFAGDSGSGLGLIESGITSLGNKILEKLPTFIQIGSSIVKSLVSAITTNLPSLVSTGLTAIKEIGASLIANLPALAEAAVQIITELAGFLTDPSAVTTLIDTALAVIDILAQGLNTALPVLIPAIVNIILTIIDKLTEPNTMMLLTNATVQLFGGIVMGIIQSIPSIVKTIPSIISNVIQTLVMSFPALIASLIGLIDGLGSDAGNAITTMMTDQWNTVKTYVTNILNSVKQGLSDAVTAISTKLTSIKTKFTSIFTSIKTTITGVISSIKSAFNFEWSLPDLKLPHLSVSGGEAPWGIGGKGSLPTFDIQWYRKAYDDAYMLNNPTIFGFAGGTLLGGGEGNGGEMIMGEEYFQKTMLEAASRMNITLITRTYIAGEEIDGYTEGAEKRISLVGGGRG